MKTTYYSIRSTYTPELSYSLTKTLCENDVLSYVTKAITEASAKRLMQYAFLTCRMLEWRGNIFTFIVDEPEELSPAENTRLDELITIVPAGPLSEEEMSKVFAYFGVDPDENETEG